MDSIRFGKYTIDVLYEDNHLLAVVKPPNLPVQADSSGDRDLLTILKDYIAEKPGKAYLGLVHRLDRPVGGAMVFARTSKAASRLSEQFSNHTAEKLYYAVLQGEMRGARTLENALLQDEKTGMVKEAKPGAAGAKIARLHTEPVSVKNGLTLTQVRLETGRKHQIRVQHALCGLPLWGDARYGGGKSGQQIALWAHSLTVVHPTLKQEMTFRCLPPKEGAWKLFRDDLWTGENG